MRPTLYPIINDLEPEALNRNNEKKTARQSRN
jgi:hypothetical protein